MKIIKTMYQFEVEKKLAYEEVKDSITTEVYLSNDFDLLTEEEFETFNEEYDKVIIHLELMYLAVMNKRITQKKALAEFYDVVERFNSYYDDFFLFIYEKMGNYEETRNFEVYDRDEHKESVIEFLKEEYNSHNNDYYNLADNKSLDLFIDSDTLKKFRAEVKELRDTYTIILIETRENSMGLFFVETLIEELHSRSIKLTEDYCDIYEEYSDLIS